MLRQLSVIGLLATAASSTASGALVVQFDGTGPDATLTDTGVTFGSAANTTLATTDIADDTVRSTLPYSTSTALVPHGSGYNGPSIYGGAYMNSVYTSAQSTTSFGSWAQLYNNGSIASVPTSDYLQFRRNGASGGSNASVTRMAMLFETSGPGPYGLDSGSSFTLTGQATVTGEIGKWLLVSGGTTYVSEANINFTTKGHETYTMSDPDATNWAVWTPGADLSLGALTYGTPGADLDQITRAGFFVDKTGSPGLNPVFSVFEADLAAVPEPASLAAAGLAALLLGRRRRG